MVELRLFICYAAGDSAMTPADELSDCADAFSVLMPTSLTCGHLCSAAGAGVGPVPDVRLLIAGALAKEAC